MSNKMVDVDALKKELPGLYEVRTGFYGRVKAQWRQVSTIGDRSQWITFGDGTVEPYFECKVCGEKTFRWAVMSHRCKE